MELQEVGGTRPFFLLQVKTTKDSVDSNGKLPVAVAKEKVQALNEYPVPTYLTVILERTGEGFLLSMNGERKSGFSQFPATYPLNKRNRQQLWDEVKDFWDKHSRAGWVSQFK